MNNRLLDGIRRMLKASTEVESGLQKGADLMLKGMEQRRVDFEKKKKDIEDDIRRGSKLSKGRFPH